MTNRGSRMRTFKAVVKRDHDNGKLIGYFPAFPGTEARGSDLDEIQDGLRTLALNLLSRESGAGAPSGEVGIETVSVL